MPDSLDPTGAIVEGFTAPVVRLSAFMAVSGGSFILGTNIHALPTWLTTIPKVGPAFILDVFRSFDGTFPLKWVGMMMHSCIFPWLLPFCLLWLYLLIKLWQDSEMFIILFWLALAHALHTFLYKLTTEPLGKDTLLACVAMAIAEAIVAGLLLWWRHVKENTPVMVEDPEPEL